MAVQRAIEQVPAVHHDEIVRWRQHIEAVAATTSRRGRGDVVVTHPKDTVTVVNPQFDDDAIRDAMKRKMEMIKSMRKP